MVNGEVKNALDPYAFGLNPAFERRNDTSIGLTALGHGNLFTRYTKGTRIREILVGESPCAAVPA